MAIIERIPLDPNRTPAMVDEELPNFIRRLQQQFVDHYNQRGFHMAPPTIFIAGGRKYIKIAKRDNQTSVHCFVRAADGAILKAASWKAPALNFARGSIFDAHIPPQIYGY